MLSEVSEERLIAVEGSDGRQVGERLVHGGLVRHVIRSNFQLLQSLIDGIAQGLRLTQHVEKRVLDDAFC